MTPRKYLVAYITIKKRKIVLIEIERQRFSLSTLLLYTINGNANIKFKNFIVEILNNLVNKNGKWDSMQLIRYNKEGLYSGRIRHSKYFDCRMKNSDRLYQKISSIIKSK